MRPRDIALVGTLVAIVGFAAADALRARDDRPRERRTAAASTQSQDEARKLVPIPAEGSLLVAGGANCRLREFRAATADELPVPPLATDCRIFAAPEGGLVAYVTSDVVGYRDAVRIAAVDVADPRRRLRRVLSFGPVAWSPDGRRLAWCEPLGRSGRAVVVGQRRIRPLPRCPLSFTQRGEPALAYGRRLVARDRTLVTASAPVEAASFGVDGSFAILAGRRIERWDDGALRHARTLPSEIDAEPPLFAPDNCAALFELEREVRLVDVGCSTGDDRIFDGTQAAWSPDGQWVAVANEDGIGFYQRPADAEVARWVVDAQDLAWR